MEQPVVVRRRLLSAHEMVRRVVVRPARPEEIPRWNALIREHHYLGLKQMVGETLRHIAVVDGEWVALLGWCSAAFKVGPRDAWIGWTPEQKDQRLRFVAQNARFLILPGRQIPNLASRILTLSTRRLSPDWQATHGHPIVLAETFVDPARFVGTCYRAAGWICLGETKGFGKRDMTYVAHQQPKTVWLRPLFRLARPWLQAPFDVPGLHPRTSPAIDLNRVPLSGQDGLFAALAQVPDTRKRRGIRHSQLSVLAVAACAVLAGCRSFVAMADFGQTLSQDVLRCLGCRRCPRTGRWQAPSEPTIRRALERIDGDTFDRVVGAFLHRIAPADAVAFDGKTLRGSGNSQHKPRHLMAVVTHQTAVALAQRAVAAKDNEISEAQPLLQPLDLRGKVVTADALHTQRGLARYLVEHKGADYVFTVKDNQPSLRRDIANLPDWELSPPVYGAREGTRPDGEADDSAQHRPARQIRFPLP